MGLIDAVELIGYDDPTELPSHWGPWEHTEFSQAEFPILRGVDLYYQYLNAGFRLPITAGTDKMGDNIPVGSNRLYVPVEGSPDYSSWLAGLRAGSGFVTNGPILNFEVDGYKTGEVVTLDSTGAISARATAQSVIPFGKLEIVCNGKVVETVYGPRKASEEGIYAAHVESTVGLETSCWIAARVVQLQGGRQRILPRQLSVFAHTNPVYFHLHGAKVREEPSIRYLQRYLQTSTRWLEEGSSFADAQTKKKALELAEEAAKIYEAL